MISRTLLLGDGGGGATPGSLAAAGGYAAVGRQTPPRQPQQHVGQTAGLAALAEANALLRKLKDFKFPFNEKAKPAAAGGGTSAGQGRGRAHTANPSAADTVENLERTRVFLAGALKPYPPVTTKDTAKAKTLRAVTMLRDGCTNIPMIGGAARAVKMLLDLTAYGYVPRAPRGAATAGGGGREPRRATPHPRPRPRQSLVVQIRLTRRWGFPSLIIAMLLRACHL